MRADCPHKIRPVDVSGLRISAKRESVRKLGLHALAQEEVHDSLIGLINLGGVAVRTTNLAK